MKSELIRSTRIEESIMQKICYCNDPKLSDRQVWANSIEPDQTAPETAV